MNAPSLFRIIGVGAVTITAAALAIGGVKKATEIAVASKNVKFMDKEYDKAKADFEATKAKRDALKAQLEARRSKVRQQNVDGVGIVNVIS